MKAAAVAIDRAIEKRFLLAIRREAIPAKMSKNRDEAMRYDWYLDECDDAKK